MPSLTLQPLDDAVCGTSTSAASHGGPHGQTAVVVRWAIWHGFGVAAGWDSMGPGTTEAGWGGGERWVKRVILYNS